MASGRDVYPFTNKEDEILCPLRDFPESVWQSHLNAFESFTFDKQANDICAKEIEILKEKVRSMLNDEQREAIEKLNLIDTVERLGISYHFEKEIEGLLEEIFHQNQDFEAHLHNNLFATALYFRLLRQHGFKITSGVFDLFLDENDEFKETLNTDIKGLLSLYEAAHVRTHDDNILEKALSFTTTHLEHYRAQASTTMASSSLVKQVSHALEQSLHRCLPRIEARHYISIYEEEDESVKNPLLLRLAKLDYKLLQMLYKKEFEEILRWAKDLQIVSKVTYSRERLVESYFAAIAVLFEPQYSLDRIIYAKTVVLIVLVDDTYDAYCSIEGQRAFTDAVERWDMKEMDRLPEYMRPTYSALLNLVEWVEQETTKQARPYAFSMYKEEFKNFARACYTEYRWFLTGELPPFQDYVENGLTTGGCCLVMPTSLIDLESATIDVFNWLAEKPKSFVASARILRLMNDVATHELEKKRNTKTGLECYMEHYNVSEEEAKNKLEEICEDDWKDINEEFLERPRVVPREILLRILNHARMANFFYKHRKNGFTNPRLAVEPHIIDLLLDVINV